MILDDEEIVTRSIANLLALETDYKTLPFQQPREALDAVRRERIDCVITDFLMPEMDGLEFLRRLRRMAPDVPAIMLTGYADKESAIAAVNEVNLYQYLEKPWDNDHLQLVIRNAVSHRTLQQELVERLRELDSVLKDRDTLRLTTEHIEQELALAQQVQQSILPRDLDGAGAVRFYHRYYPTGRLGGDYFDVIFTGENRFNAIVSDVAGHGVAAALGTMLVKVIFADASQRGLGCSEMLIEMNDRLVRFLPQQQFVTAFVLQVDLDAGIVSAASAGGPHPIILGSGNGVPVEQWHLNGLPLGAFNRDIFREPEAQSRPLRSGDRILLYTDGLLDVEIESGQSREPHEIAAFVDGLRNHRGEEFLERLVDRCGARRSMLPDDINLLLIEAQDRPR